MLVINRTVKQCLWVYEVMWLGIIGLHGERSWYHCYHPLCASTCNMSDLIKTINKCSTIVRFILPSRILKCLCLTPAHRNHRPLFENSNRWGEVEWLAVMASSHHHQLLLVSDIFRTCHYYCAGQKQQVPIKKELIVPTTKN